MFCEANNNPMKSKQSITTKGGDSGQTYTLAGDRVWKDDLRVAIPGGIDELNTRLSAAKLYLDQNDYLYGFLEWVQVCLFVIAARVSDPCERSRHQRQIGAQEMGFIDSICRHYEQATLMPTSFIIPGTNHCSCQFDLARITARLLERQMVAYCRQFPQHKISSATLAFLNRLSDLLYICARHAEQGSFTSVDYQRIDEFPRQPLPELN